MVALVIASSLAVFLGSSSTLPPGVKLDPTPIKLVGSRVPEFAEGAKIDPRVTYYSDYRVRVRVAGQTVWLKRPNNFGLYRVKFFGPDGSFLYRYRGYSWVDGREFIWHRGKTKEILEPSRGGFDTTWYLDRDNFGGEAVEDVGPRDYPLSHPRIYEYKKGKFRWIGYGRTIHRSKGGSIVASLALFESGEPAGLNMGEKFLNRVYSPTKSPRDFESSAGCAEDGHVGLVSNNRLLIWNDGTNLREYDLGMIKPIGVGKGGAWFYRIKNDQVFRVKDEVARPVKLVLNGKTLSNWKNIGTYVDPAVKGLHTSIEWSNREWARYSFDVK